MHMKANEKYYSEEEERQEREMIFEIYFFVYSLYKNESSKTIESCDKHVKYETGYSCQVGQVHLLKDYTMLTRIFSRFS